MKLSLIVTVYNEENTISDFINSVTRQSVLPFELIIVDGGSTDNTVNEINNEIVKHKKKLRIRLIVKKGNRSVGRNEAIKKSSSEIILCSDAGNILDKNWVKNIIKPFSDSTIEVVAGYYKAKAESLFQKCLAPYVLVMPDKLSKNNFLPATRSMAFRKSAWKKVGGFDEKLSHNEDFVFANKLNEKNIKIVFAKDAIVKWIPRSNIFQAFKMFFRFARGDIQAGIIREKVLLLFTRYVLFLYFIYLSAVYRSNILTTLLLIGAVIYILWSIIKQYRYVNNWKAVFVFPIIQITADISVIAGSAIGFFDRVIGLNFKKHILINKVLTFLILLYTVVVLSTINWGIPNTNHPFAYGMDEWHSLESLRSVIIHGTASVEGAANGPILYYLLTGIYLIPFILIGFIKPWEIKSPVDNLVMQNKLFEVLRLSTVIYGVLSIILVYKILKKHFKNSEIIGTLFFTLSPIFFVLSNYFKYDPAVNFWIILSIFFILEYKNNQSFKKLIFAAIICGFAISVKISALPLIPIFIISFLLFTKNITEKLKNLGISLFIMMLTFFVFGIPDIIFKTSSYLFYLSENLVRIPQSVSNFNLGTSWLTYLLTVGYPSIFGLFETILFYCSFIYLLGFLLIKTKNKKILDYRLDLFFITSFLLFEISLIPLKLTGGGSRAMVLIPFMAFVISITFLKFIRIIKKYWKVVFVILSLGFLIQAIQITSWIYLKWQSDPQQTSSLWIKENIKNGTQIGLENIPIYQNVPDIILKEFYKQQYKSKENYLYTYKILYSDDEKFPEIVVVTNGDLQSNFKSSPTKDLLKTLRIRKYKEINKFSLDFSLFNVFNDKGYLIFGNLVQVPSDIRIYQK